MYTGKLIRENKLLFGVIVALVLMLGIGYGVMAQSGGAATVSFNHYGDGALIAEGNLTLTAPETIGAEHNFLHWEVDGQQVAGRTITVDMSSAGSVQAIYNPTAITIDIHLQDSDGSPLSGGSLRYHDGSWKTVAETSTGHWSISTEASSITYEMTYNNGRQTKSNVSTTQTTVDFTTVSTEVALEDFGGADQTGGTVRYHQLGWQNFGSANTSQELLPGNYTFEMTYNNGRQTKSNETVPDGNPPPTDHPILFKTVTVTPALKDSDGSSPTGTGTVRYHQIGWENWDDVANTSMELLPGNYTFQMTYNNGRQTKSNYNIPDGADAEEVLFETVTTDVKLATSAPAGLSGGSVRYHQLGWEDYGTTDGSGITTRELLPGNYTFQMTFNNGRQTFSNYPIPDGVGSEEVLFTTVSTTVSLKDHPSDPLSGGTVRYHQLGWQNFGAGNDTKELLPGKYTFQMTFNNGRQTKSNVDVPAGASHEVPFVTTTTIVRLADCGDNGYEDGSVRYHQLGWENYGDTDSSGNVAKELLPGNYTFQMTFNNGRQTFSNHTVPAAASEDPHTVLYTTSAVTFDYPGTVRYHQLGWETFVQPTMHLLPGNYTFKFVEDNLTISNASVSGCSTTGELTVEIPGMSGVRVEVRQTDGSLVAAKNNQSNQAIFNVDNGVYDVILKKGAFTKTVEDVVVFGATTLTDLVATLDVDLEGLSGVRVEVRTDDGNDVAGADGSAGGMVFAHNNQSGLRHYTVLRGDYDVVLIKGAQSYFADGIDCNGATCDAGDVVDQLGVNYENMSGVRIEVRTDDGDDDGSTGGMVFAHNNQSGSRTYDVLKAPYDLLFTKGASSKIVDVDCSTGGSCNAGNFIATMTADYGAMSGVRIEVRTDDDPDNPNTAGGMVFAHNNQSGTKHYDVFMGEYDLILKKGAQSIVVDVPCTGDTCNVPDFVSTLTVDYENMSGVRIEVLTDGTRNMVFAHNNQSNDRTYDVLKSHYDLKFIKGASEHFVDVDCTNDCDAGDFITTLNVDYENMSGVRIEIRTDDQVVGTYGGMVLAHNNQSGIRNYDVLNGSYDLVFKKGAKTKVVDGVSCDSGGTCSPGDIVATLTVDYGSLTGVRIEVYTSDGSGLVIAHNNQSGSRNYDLLKNTYDVVLKKGSSSGTADDVDCTGNTCTLDGGNLTVFAPNGTRVEIRSSDGSSVVTSINNVGSDKKHVFTDLAIGLYDVYLIQGAATTIVDDFFFVTTQTLDQLMQWTVFAPNGTKAEVRVPDTTGVVTSISNVGSDKKHVFDVVPNTYDLYLEQGAGEKTVENISVTANLTTDELCQLTVFAPNGTRAEVRVADGSGVVTSINNVGSDKKHVFDVVKGTYDLYLKQGAGEKILTGVDAVDCSGESQTVDQLVQWTVFAPNGTAVEVLIAEGSGIVTNIGNVGSDKKHVFDVVPNTYELFLTQGAGTRAVGDTAVNANTTNDELCQLTVFAPNGTAVEVRVVGTSDVVTSIGNVGSDKKHVFDVIKGTWELYLQQGAATKTVSNVDCSGEDQTEDQLVQWTVFAPNGTEAKVYTFDRSGVVTSISNVGSDKKHVFDVVPNTYDLKLIQGAQETWLDNVDVTSNKSDDQLCKLTAFAPNGSAIDVRVTGTSMGLVTSIGNVGSDNKHVFDVVKGNYNVFSGIVVEVVDCSGETASVTFSGSSSVTGSGTLEATHGSPTVTFNATVPSGTFDIVYPTGTGHARAGVTVGGDIVCMRFTGSTVYLLGEVTSTNSSEWPVGYYVRFGLDDNSPDKLNYTVGESSMPDCGTFSHPANLPVVSGDFAIVP